MSTIDHAKPVSREELREQLAALAHDQWSGWMRYLFGRCRWNADGSMTIPAVSVGWWRRQLSTPYAELSEPEKDSDRKEADRYLAIFDMDFKALRDERDEVKAKLAEVERVLRDIEHRAKRIREDKAIVGTEAFYIESIARQALTTQGQPSREDGRDLIREENVRLLRAINAALLALESSNYKEVSNLLRGGTGILGSAQPSREDAQRLLGGEEK